MKIATRNPHPDAGAGRSTFVDVRQTGMPKSLINLAGFKVWLVRNRGPGNAPDNPQKISLLLLATSTK